MKSLLFIQVHEMLAEHAIKEEPMDEAKTNEHGVVIDSTMEYCRNLGGFTAKIFLLFLSSLGWKYGVTRFLVYGGVLFWFKAPPLSL